MLRTLVPIRSDLRSSATASSREARSPACHGRPMIVGGIAMPAAVSTVGVMSVRIDDVVALGRAGAEVGARRLGPLHIATRRCGTDPWSPIPASTTWVSAGSSASTAPTSASAARTAARRASAGTASGSLASLPSTR